MLTRIKKLLRNNFSLSDLFILPMSDWVEYCTEPAMGRWARLRRANGHEKPFGVKYWSIGNENYTGGEIGAKTAQQWGPFVRESAKMMRRVDPGIRILAAAVPDVD